MSSPNGTYETRNIKSGSEKEMDAVTWVTTVPVRRRHRYRHVSTTQPGGRVKLHGRHPKGDLRYRQLWAASVLTISLG